MPTYISGIVVLCAVAFVASQEIDFHKYDNIDVDKILSNQRLYRSYFNCIMGTGKCTPDGKDLRAHIPHTLQDLCPKCNEEWKRDIEKVLRYIMNEKPEDFKKLLAKFDPEGIHVKKHGDKYKLIAQGKKVL